jgi:hypothetical protein
MGQRPKAKRKREGRKNTDKEQSERFIETARIVGAEDADKFESAFRKIITPKRTKPS